MKYFLGLDIGGTKTNMRLEHESGAVTSAKRFQSTPDFNELYKNILSFIKGCGVLPAEVGAMCCGIPGCASDGGKTVKLIPSLGWENVSLDEKLFLRFPFPCVAINDVNAALYAEADRGYRADNMLFISIGTGLGSAFMLDGKIFDGFSGAAGEIGYLLNDFEAERLTKKADNGVSNDFGALESKVSGSALEGYAAGIGLDARSLFKSYAENEGAREIIDKFILRLSCAIANCVSILNPEIVVLGGGVSEALSPFIETISEYTSRLTPIETKIYITGMKNEAGVIGACVCARQLLKSKKIGG